MSSVGRDITPDVGMRVEDAAGVKGVGTIITVHLEGRAVAVRWDHGGSDPAAATGEGGKYDLVLHRKAVRHAPTNGTNGTARMPATESRRSAEALLSNNWLEQVSGHRQFGTPAPQTGDTLPAGLGSMGSVHAKGAGSKSTVGISVYGTVIDYLVPGAPAHLTQRLAKDDEIVEVDGQRVTAENVTGLIRGSDQVGSLLRMKVLKGSNGQVVEVELQRVAKANIATMVKLFELLTQLKQNGANIEALERQAFPPEQDLSVDLVDKVVALVTQIQGERMMADTEHRSKFQGLYQQLRASLLEAYDEVDRLQAQLDRNVAEDHAVENEEEREKMARELGAEADRYHVQITRMAGELEVVTQELKDARDKISDLEGTVAAEKAAEKELKDRLGAYKKAHHLTDHDVHRIVTELETKKEQLATALESAMQHDFAMTTMTADGERMRAEIDVLNAQLAAQAHELGQRGVEDLDLEQKIHGLQLHLEEQGEALAAKEAELQVERRSIADRVEEMARVKDAEMAELQATLRARQQALEATEVEVSKRDKRLDLLNATLAERDAELDTRLKRILTLEEEAEIAREHAADNAVQIKDLERHVLEAPWREGDLLEVSVVAAKHLPGEAGDDAEWFVMTAIDEKHQVSQTHKVRGADPHFHKDYTSAFDKTSRMVTAAVYCSERGQPGELVGHCKVALHDLPYAPGSLVAYEIVDDEGKALHDADGNTARIEMVLCKNNYPASREEVIVKQAELIEALRTELEAERAAIEQLAAQIKELESAKHTLEATALECQCELLKPEVPRLEALLAENRARRDQQAFKISELEDEVSSKDDLIAELTVQLDTAKETAATQSASLKKEIERLKATVKGLEGAASETAARTQERDAEARKAKLAGEDVLALKKALADAKTRIDTIEGERTGAREVSMAEIKRKDAAIAEVQGQLSKTEGMLEKEKRLFEEERNTKNARIEELSKQVSELKQELKEVGEGRSSAQAEGRSLKAQLEAAQRGAAEKQARLEAQMAKAAAAAEEHRKRLDAKVEELLATLAKVKQELLDQRKEAQKADADARARQAKLEGTLREKETFLKQAGESADVRVRDLTNKIRLQQEKVGALEADREKDAKELERLRVDLNVSKEGRAAADADGKAKAAKIEGLEAQLEKLEHARTEAVRRAEDLAHQLKEMGGDKSAAEKESSARQASLEALGKEKEALVRDRDRALAEKTREIDALRRELEDERKAHATEREARAAAEKRGLELAAQIAALEKERAALEATAEKERAAAAKELHSQQESSAKELKAQQASADKERTALTESKAQELAALREAHGKELAGKDREAAAKDREIERVSVELAEVKKELADLRKGLSAEHDSRSSAETLGKQLQTKLEGLEADRTQLRNELAALQRELAEVRDKKAQAEATSEARGASAAELKRELEARTKDIERMQQELAALREAKGTSESDAKLLAAKLEGLVRDKTEQLAKMEAEAVRAQAENEKRLKEREDAVAEARQDRQAALAEAKREREVALERAERDTGSRLATLEKDKDAVASDLRSQIQQLQASAERAAAQGEKEREAAERRLDEAKAAAERERETLSRKLEEANARMASLEHDLTDKLHKMTQSSTGAEEASKRLEQSVRDKTEQVHELQKEVSRLQGQLAEDRALLTKEKDAQAQELAELHRRVEDLLQKAQRAQDEAEVARRDAATKGEEADRLARQLRAMDEQAEQHRAGGSDRDAELARMSRESRALENELAALKTAYAGKEADLERLRVKQLQEELQEDDARVKQLQEELSSKDVLLRSQEQRVRELEQITTALERDVTKRGADPDGRVAAVEAENASLRARIAELEEALRAAQANSDSKKQSEAVAVLQKQVVSLQEQWKLTQQQDKAEYEAELRRLQGIISALKEQIADLQRQLALRSRDAPEQAARAPLPPPSGEAKKTAPQRGVIGIKIENKAPHKVMSVTELMDENGDIINERVGLGDELVEINGVHVSTMVVGEVIQRVSGAVDTLVRMTFRNNRESREYSVTARRHVPINAPRGSSAAAQQPVPNRYV